MNLLLTNGPLMVMYWYSSMSWPSIAMTTITGISVLPPYNSRHVLSTTIRP